MHKEHNKSTPVGCGSDLANTSTQMRFHSWCDCTIFACGSGSWELSPDPAESPNKSASCWGSLTKDRRWWTSGSQVMAWSLWQIITSYQLFSAALLTSQILFSVKQQWHGISPTSSLQKPMLTAKAILDIIKSLSFSHLGIHCSIFPPRTHILHVPLWKCIKQLLYHLPLYYPL